MSVGDRYLQCLENIHDTAIKYGRDPSEISLVAVTKGYPLKHVLPAYEAGCRYFGESRVQEALPKISDAPNDLHWHFIGTLQKNKVNKVVGAFSLIHSVDTFELAEKISRCSQEKNITTPILLQTNVSGEATKQGQTPEGWERQFSQLLSLPNLSIEGLMTMAPFVEEEKIIRTCFTQLHLFKEKLQNLGGDKVTLKHLSMGMSHDYPMAIAEGATLLRVGTAIFGHTQKN